MLPMAFLFLMATLHFLLPRRKFSHAETHEVSSASVTAHSQLAYFQDNVDNECECQADAQEYGACCEETE